jgi:hypothetical protein
MPPYLVYLRVTDQGRTKVRLWLPLFLLWLLLLPLFVLILVVALLADLFTLPTGNVFGFTRFLFGVLGILGATRGTQVQVNAHDRKHAHTSVALTLR